MSLLRLPLIYPHHLPTKENGMKTTCEECGNVLTLTIVDGDGVLIGDECVCGYYVTRYLPGQTPA